MRGEEQSARVNHRRRCPVNRGGLLFVLQFGVLGCLYEIQRFRDPEGSREAAEGSAGLPVRILSGTKKCQ